MLPASVRNGEEPVAGYPAAELYIELLKRTLVNWPYRDMQNTALGLNPRQPQKVWQLDLLQYWRTPRHTMLELAALDTVQFCVEDALAANVPGDFIETGVWRGGVPILMRALLAAHRTTERRVWVADSFKGLPPPNVEKYPADRDVALDTIEELRVSLDQVRSHFDRYGLLDDQVQFLPGWFRDTLPAAPIEKLAVMRLDGDMYESTTDALTALYPRLSPGGYVIVDDYGAILACRQAIQDYRTAHGIEDPMVATDWTGVYWQKGGRQAAGLSAPPNGSDMQREVDGPLTTPAGGAEALEAQIRALTERLEYQSSVEAGLRRALLETNRRQAEPRGVFRSIIPAPLQRVLRRAFGIEV